MITHYPSRMGFEFDKLPNGDLRIRRTGKLDLCYARDLLRRSDIDGMVEILDLAGFDPYDLQVLSERHYESIGALTSAPILATEVGIDDAGNLDEIGEIWWYPNYMIENPVREILKGEAVFQASANA